MTRSIANRRPTAYKGHLGLNGQFYRLEKLVFHHIQDMTFYKEKKLHYYVICFSTRSVKLISTYKVSFLSSLFCCWLLFFLTSMHKLHVTERMYSVYALHVANLHANEKNKQTTTKNWKRKLIVFNKDSHKS